MKKGFYVGLALLSVGGYASAQGIYLDQKKSITTETIGRAMRAAESRAAGTYDIRFCGEAMHWYPVMQEDCDVYLYIDVPAEIATQLAGNKITDLIYSISFDNYSTVDDRRPGKMLVWEGDEVKAETPISIYDSYLVESRNQTSAFDADNQYVIKENTPFRFGIWMEGWGWDFPACTDNGPATALCGTVDCIVDGVLEKHMDMGHYTGANLYLYARTYGEKDGIYDYFTLTGVEVGAGGFTYPVLKSDQDLMVNVSISNQGDNELTTLDYSYLVNGTISGEGTAQISIPPRTTATCQVPVKGYPVGNNNIDLSIDRINGVATEAKGSSSFYNLGNSAGFNRKFLVEEGTGTWCGWCPRGIVGFEYMNDTYPDNFVGITVHCSDAMEVESYKPVALKFFEDFPSAIVNRDPKSIVDPGIDGLSESYALWSGQRSPVRLSMAVSKILANPNLPDVSAFAMDMKIEFAQSEPNGKYLLAFVVVEDDLAGFQSNYYQGSDEVCGEWQHMADPQLWSYEDVARGIYEPFGIEGLLPEQIEAGKIYNVRYEVPTEDVNNVEKTSVIAMVLEGNTGTVLNAYRVNADQYDKTNAVQRVIAEPAEAPSYYNLQGVKVADPAQGNCYIRVQNGTASKIVY